MPSLLSGKFNIKNATNCTLFASVKHISLRFRVSSDLPCKSLTARNSSCFKATTSLKTFSKQSTLYSVKRTYICQVTRIRLSLIQLARLVSTDDWPLQNLQTDIDDSENWHENVNRKVYFSDKKKVLRFKVSSESFYVRIKLIYKFIGK